MSYYTKITKVGLAAITAAINDKSKLPITYMAFGDGDGSIPEPNENASSLVNEVYRTGVNKVEVHNKNPNWLVCEAIIPSAVGGFNIREVALYDNTGTKMLAIASYPPTYKPTVEEGAAKIQTIRIVLQVDNTGNFELVIDPDVVLATTGFVEEKIKNIDILSNFSEIKGDGFNNDTIGFDNLENKYKKQNIDLLGKTYRVDKVPFSNNYVNGKFLVDESIIYPNAENFKIDSVNMPLSASTNDSMSGLLWGWYITSTWVTGQDSNAVQSFALDEKNRRIYCMFTTGTYDTSTVIYAMPMDRGSGFTSPIWAADADRRVGHQGLAVENNRNGNTYLWATKQTNIGLPETTDPQAGCKVIRFPIDGVPSYSTAGGAVNEWTGKNGLYFENVQEFQLWDSVNTTQNAQATISHDQRYLLSKMNTPNGYRIRIFELQALVNEGPGDYSKKYIHEFSAPSIANDPIKGIGIQNMACDGKFIYFYAGRNKATDGKVISIVIYDLFGNYINGTTVGDLGLYDSINYPRSNVEGVGDISETEGIAIATINGTPQILVHFAAGTGGYRPNLIYALGMKQGNFRGSKNTPALLLDNPHDGLSLAVPRYNRVAQFGVIDVNGNQYTNIQFARQNIYIGGSEVNSPIPMISVPSSGNSSMNFYGNLTHFRGGDLNAPMRYVGFRSRTTDWINYTQKAVQNGDAILEFSACADDGANPLTTANVGVKAAAMTFRVSGPVSTGYVPTLIDFLTSSETESITSRFRILADGHFVPSATNKYTIGNSGATIKEIYLGVAPIVLSDERLKQQFRNQSDAEKAAALEIKASICLYKFNDAVDLKGDGARWHVGVKAQQIVSILESHNLNWRDYGFICFDQWDDQDEVIEEWEDEFDEDHNLARKAGRLIIQEARKAGNKFAVRYDELTMFILAAI